MSHFTSPQPKQGSIKSIYCSGSGGYYAWRDLSDDGESGACCVVGEVGNFIIIQLLTWYYTVGAFFGIEVQ
jgi:hypothetical protein